MRFRIAGAFLGIVALAPAATAQPTPPPATITRTVIAAAKLPSVTEVPLYFRVVGGSLPPGETSTLSATNGIFYLVSGAVEVSVDQQGTNLNPGEGLFIAAEKTATLKATGEVRSTFIHFFLTLADDRDRPAEQAPATVWELFRTAAPIPDLKQGTYDLNLTRVTFPAETPANPPHHRSGAALYYVVSGTGSQAVNGTTEDKGPRSFIYEPSSLVHQWGNPGKEPFTFLAFNINPEGVAAVLPGALAKTQ